MDDPRLTKERLVTARVIARGRRIRDLDRLLAAYGGEPSRWRKMSTRPFQASPDRWVELHWYEHHGLGRFEIKEVASTLRSCASDASPTTTPTAGSPP